MSRFRIGAFAVVVRDEDEVLLCLREDLGIWNLPGGGVEREESPWEAVVREVREETGLEVRIQRLAGLYWRPREQEVAFSFVCRVVSGEMTRTWEAVETGYFAVGNVPERSNHRHLEMIRDALQRPEEVFMRTQAGPSTRDLVERGRL